MRAVDHYMNRPAGYLLIRGFRSADAIADFEHRLDRVRQRHPQRVVKGAVLDPVPPSNVLTRAPSLRRGVGG